MQRVAIGEFVNKINGIAANKITMKSLTAITMSKTSAIDERYLCDALTNVPIRPMDVVVIPYFKFGLPFTVINIPFNSNYSDTSSSAFMVSANTRFDII